MNLNLVLAIYSLIIIRGWDVSAFPVIKFLCSLNSGSTTKSRVITRPSCVRPSWSFSKRLHRGTAPSRGWRTTWRWPPASRTRSQASCRMTFESQTMIFELEKCFLTSLCCFISSSGLLGGLTGEGKDPHSDGGEWENFRGEEGTAEEDKWGRRNGEQRHEDRLDRSTQVCSKIKMLFYVMNVFYQKQKSGIHWVSVRTLRTH